MTKFKRTDNIHNSERELCKHIEIEITGTEEKLSSFADSAVV